MRLSTVVHDCLHLNWALPPEALPPPPAPLRYQVHAAGDRDWVFASALLFHLDAVRIEPLPLPRFSYPQLTLRLSVLGAHGEPSVLFRRLLVPAWMVPVARFVGRQPARAARLDFPRPSRAPRPLDDQGEGWHWRVSGRSTFAVHARPAPPGVAQGESPGVKLPDFGGFEATVRHFQEVTSGYVPLPGKLRPVRAIQPQVAPLPVRATVTDDDLLAEGLRLDAGAGPVVLHSAWLVPEVPLSYALEPLIDVQRAEKVPVGVGAEPAAG